MPERTLQKVSEELIELAASGHTAPPFSSRYRKLDAEMGYRAMRRLHEHRLTIGWKPVGRKIGFTNRTIWPRYGVHQPIWGFVYEQTVLRAEKGRVEVPLDGGEVVVLQVDRRSFAAPDESRGGPAGGVRGECLPGMKGAA